MAATFSIADATRGRPRRSTLAAGLAVALLAATGASAAQSDASLAKAAAAAAAGCEVTAEQASHASLGPWPGAPGMLAVAVMTDEPSGDDLGLLCVGAVRRVGNGFSAVAKLSPDAEEIRPPSGISVVSLADASLDPTAFRFAPGETLLGVRVQGETNTTSTNYTTERLYLFRRTGARLVPVFDAQTQTSLLDKTGDDPAKDVAWLVRFDGRLTHGAFGLTLYRKGTAGRRYLWTGSRYVRGR